MLKKRVIPVLLYSGGRLVKTVRFDLANARDVGDPVKSVGVYNSQLADEIILVNIERQGRGWTKLGLLLDNISRVCFMPLTVGGGIRTFEDAAYLIARGADKVVINTAAYSDKKLLSDIAARYGNQAVVVGVDARYDDSLKRYVLYGDCGRTAVGIDISNHIEDCVRAGAGEFFVQSIDRDGSMQGFDLDLLRLAVQATVAPVIGCGGSGNYEQLRDAFLTTGVSAVACGSIFNFSDSNPIRAKAFLSNYGLPFKVV